jgi:hypothetical protein
VLSCCVQLEVCLRWRQADLDNAMFWGSCFSVSLSSSLSLSLPPSYSLSHSTPLSYLHDWCCNECVALDVLDKAILDLELEEVP